MLVLAGDIGGTNSRLALFETGTATAAPVLRLERTYPSKAHAGLGDIAEKFLGETRAAAPDVFKTASSVPERACFGIAGPVEGNIGHATNLPWVVDGAVLSQRLGIGKLRLVNDFSAAAIGCLSVPSAALAGLGGGQRAPKGPVAVLGPGTGLGQAFLLWSPADDRYEVVPSEGGHADFAARTLLETDLLAHLTAKYGRVSYERLLSGRGLVDAYTFLSARPSFRASAHADTVAAMATDDPAAVISRRALDESDPACVAALTLFCGALGALAGNLALTILATGGVFVAGGIAPRILPFLQRGGFREAFEHKGRLQPLCARIPAFVVTHAEPGLLGAAIIAARL